jgi:sarcosine oxidase/L-pipecolate oxidase
MGVSKQGPIAIVGGGAFGLSTALELSNQGYSNVTVFEKDEEIPSRWSAANDLNKIMRAEYEDDFYTDLAVVCSTAYIIDHIKLTVTRKRQKPGKLRFTRHIFTVLAT